MDEQDIQHILAKMTNFYRDHLPINSSYEDLLQVYGQLFSVVYAMMQAANDSTFIEKTHTLQTIPYFKIESASGFYDPQAARQLSFLGFDEQLVELDRRGWFIEMIFSSDVNQRPIVYAMTLKTSFVAKDALVLYQDYFIRSNKLYLLPNFILSRSGASNHLHAFDIKVDDKRLERNWGVLYDLELGPLLPRYEYREVIKGYDRVFSENLTIKNIKEAIRAVTNWERFDLQDSHSRTLPTAKKRLYDQWIISPAQFIVSIPEEIIQDKVRISILAHLLDQVREPWANFVMFYDFLRVDPLRHLNDKVKPTVSYKVTEKPTGQDTKSQTLSMKFEDGMFRQEDSIYYDDKLIYDTKSALDLEIVSSFDGQTYTDKSKFDQTKVPTTDDFRVYVRTFPEIPRNFVVLRTANPGEFKLQCRPNSDGTTDIEFYGATEKYGTYELLQKVYNEQFANAIEWIDNANLSGKTYYKVRAIAPDYQSMMTLPIDTATI